MAEFAQEVWPVAFVRPRMFYKETSNGNTPVPDAPAKALAPFPVETPTVGGRLPLVAKWLPGDSFDAALRLTFKDAILWSEPPPNVARVVSGLPQDIGSALIWPTFVTAGYAGTGPTVTITISQMDVAHWTYLATNINSRIVGLDMTWHRRQDLEERAAVILAAEQRQFTDPDDRRIVKDLLVEAAETLYRTNERRWEPMVWSAIRRYASMLAPEEVGSLDTFLGWNGVIETRIVSLIAVQIVFFNKPSPNEAVTRTLGDAIIGIAEEAFRAEQPVPGDHAALAQQCVFALAALGDRRLQECVSWMTHWGQRWFMEQVQKRLEEMAKRWDRREWSDFQQAALNRLGESLMLLNESLR